VSSRFALLLAGACALAAPALARAQTFTGSFQFANPAGTPTNSFSIPAVGGTADVRVYLLETDSLHLLQNTGLFSAEVRVSFNNPGGIAAVASVNDILRNIAFDQQNPPTGVTATAAILNEAAFNNPIVLAPATDPNRIYLGTFRFTGQAAGTVTLGSDSPVTSGGTLLGNGTDISNLIGAAPSATLTVAPVPEPATGLLAAAVGLAAAGAARRLRRRPAVGDPGRQ
jgi:hypothetical protein